MLILSIKKIEHKNKLYKERYMVWVTANNILILNKKQLKINLLLKFKVVLI